MYAIYFHTGFTLVLFFLLLIFGVFIRQDPFLKQFDQTKLYSYKKFIVDHAALETSLTQNISNSWIDSDDPTKACTDLRPYDFPKVLFSDAVTNCSVHYDWVLEAGTGNIKITGATLPQPYLCKAGTYALRLAEWDPVGTLTAAGTGAMNLVISSTKTATFSLANTVLGNNFTSQGTVYQNCLTKRRQLVDWIQFKTDCSTENSQFCSCVYMFTKPILNPVFVFPSTTQRTVTLSSILSDSITECSLLRKSRDVRTNWAVSDHKQSQMLFAIALSLLMNFVFHGMNYWYEKYGSGKAATTSFLLLVVIGLSIAYGMGINGASTAWLEILVIGVSMAVLHVYFDWYFLDVDALVKIDKEHKSLGNEFLSFDALYKPTIHPVWFGFVYACLNNYVLVHRGVIQQETIGVEMVKSFGVAWIYTQIVIYYADPHFPTQKLILPDRAVLLAVLLILGISLDVFYTPYGDAEGFSLVWLTPLLWVLLSISEMVWIQYLSIGYGSDFMDKLRKKKNDDIVVSESDEDFTDIRRNLVFTGVHIGYFLIFAHFVSEYIQWVDKHDKTFHYPSPVDYRVLMGKGYALAGYVHESL